MARTVKPHEFALKRDQILDSAQRLIFTKGYEEMSINDILLDIGISNGAFHHYFGSRAALLDAFIERIKRESEKRLLPILQDPERSAVEKLQGFFDALDQARMARKAEVVRLSHFWYTDANALVRQKVDAAITQQRAPLIAEIVRQGIREGVFNTSIPDKAGEVILALLRGMGDTHAGLLLSFLEERDEQRCIEGLVTTHAAYLEAIERILGAPPNSLHRTDAQAVKVWMDAIREGEPQ